MGPLLTQFLNSKVTDVKHSGRSFLEHLKGVYEILKAQAAPDYVCKAGLFHSIYGTNVFRHASVELESRPAVVDAIGPEAERLAYIFCSCDRPRALVRAANKGPPYQLINRRDGSVISLSTLDMTDLLNIEIANLMEQNSLSLGSVVAALRQLMLPPESRPL